MPLSIVGLVSVTQAAVITKPGTTPGTTPATTPATTITTESFSGAANQLGAFTPSSTDLAQNGSSALLSSTITNGGFFSDSGADDLGNGVITNANGTRGVFLSPSLNGGSFPSVFDLTFDTSVNTLGYDISEISTFAAWVNNGASLANQLYTLEYSVVGDASFVSLGQTDFTPFDDETEETSGATRVTHTGGNGTIIASGVDAIRITFLDHGVENGGTDGTVFQEVDVIGVATVVPEPSSTALVGLGGLALLLRRRK